MASKKEREELKADAIADLRELCPPGTTVYTICTHVARSGMSRRIRCFVIPTEGAWKGRPRDITWLASKALGYRCSDQHGEGMTVSGCGMDMGFHVVHSLSYALHGLPKRQTWEETRNDERPLNERPGYTLNHRWL